MTLAENLRTYWKEHLVHVAVAGLGGIPADDGMSGQRARQSW